MKLAEIIHLCSISGRTGAIQPQGDSLTGKIFVQGGQVTHAESDNLSGEDAIYHLLKASEAAFDFAEGETSTQRTVNVGCEYLLLEAARIADEEQSSRSPAQHRATLTVISDPEERCIELKGDKISIGRAADNEVVLLNASISSHHATLERNGNKMSVADLKSMNGSYVNGTRIQKAHLKNGDILQVGATLTRFEMPSQRPEGVQPKSQTIRDTVQIKLSAVAAPLPGGGGGVLSAPEERSPRHLPVQGVIDGSESDHKSSRMWIGVSIATIVILGIMGVMVIG